MWSPVFVLSGCNVREDLLIIMHRQLYQIERHTASCQSRLRLHCVRVIGVGAATRLNYA